MSSSLVRKSVPCSAYVNSARPKEVVRLSYAQEESLKNKQHNLSSTISLKEGSSYYKSTFKEEFVPLPDSRRQPIVKDPRHSDVVFDDGENWPPKTTQSSDFNHKPDAAANSAKQDLYSHHSVLDMNYPSSYSTTFKDDFVPNIQCEKKEISSTITLQATHFNLGDDSNDERYASTTRHDFSNERQNKQLIHERKKEQDRNLALKQRCAYESKIKPSAPNYLTTGKDALSHMMEEFASIEGNTDFTSVSHESFVRPNVNPNDRAKPQMDLYSHAHSIETDGDPDAYISSNRREFADHSSHLKAAVAAGVFEERHVLRRELQGTHYTLGYSRPEYTSTLRSDFPEPSAAQKDSAVAAGIGYQGPSVKKELNKSHFLFGEEGPLTRTTYSEDFPKRKETAFREPSDVDTQKSVLTGWTRVDYGMDSTQRVAWKEAEREKMLEKARQPVPRAGASAGMSDFTGDKHKLQETHFVFGEEDQVDYSTTAKESSKLPPHERVQRVKGGGGMYRSTVLQQEPAYDPKTAFSTDKSLNFVPHEIPRVSTDHSKKAQFGAATHFVLGDEPQSTATENKCAFTSEGFEKVWGLRTRERREAEA